MARVIVLADDYVGGAEVVIGEAGPYVELVVLDQETDDGWAGECGACRWRTDQDSARRLDLDGAHDMAAIHVDRQCPAREES